MPLCSRSRRVLPVLSLTAVALLSAGGLALAATAPAPAITTLSAPSGPVAGHGKLTVHGSGFTGVTAVLFGGAKGGSVHVVSSSTLTVVVPAHAAKRLDVRVVTSHGTSRASQHDVYVYVAAPVVTSVSVPSGVVAGGVKVVVKGSGFTHVKKVLFGKTAGTKLHVASGSALSVLAPAHVAGRVDVRVVSSYGTSPVKVTDRFTFVVPPVVVAANPVITTTALAAAERGQAYTSSIVVAGGTPPYTVTQSGLPAGISASAAGAVSGTTFAVAGSYPVSVKVTDAAEHTATASLPLTVKVHPGQVFAWGDNADGELGLGTTSMTPVTAPQPVPGLTGVIQVVGGTSSGYALREDGTVYAWGSSTYGQLGDGTTNDRSTAQQVAGLSGIVSLAAGGTSAYAVRSDGTLLAWGDNFLGQLGDGTTNSASVPQPVSGPTQVVQVVAGSGSVYALQSNGQVWAWGKNVSGQLGTGSSFPQEDAPALISGLTGVTQLAARGDNAFALLSDGTVRGWGYNAQGEVGDVTTTNRNVPVAVSGLSGVTAIADADSSAYALLADGTVRAWGMNTNGELGDGSTTNRLSPVVVPGLTDVQTITTASFNVFATHPDGSVDVWGQGRLGDNADGTTTDRLSPERAPSLAGATAFAPARSAGYAIR